MTKERVHLGPLTTALTNKLCELGLASDYAATVVKRLLEAEVHGAASHGLIRWDGIVSNLLSGNRNVSGTFTAITPNIVRYDAAGQLGLVAMDMATQRCAELAKTQHMAVVAVTGYVGITGIVGYYTRALAEQGIVGLVFCGSSYAVAPPGGARALIGTNPIAIAFPGQSQNFSADLATSAWSYGDLKVAMVEGREVPLGVVQDIDGRPSTDPHDADNGSQLPMAGHKGFALGLAIELLCGPLIGAKAGREAVPGGGGALIIGLRSDTFRPEEEVIADAEALFTEIKGTRRAVDGPEIRIPGDRYGGVIDPNQEILVDSELLTRHGISP